VEDVRPGRDERVVPDDEQEGAALVGRDEGEERALGQHHEGEAGPEAFHRKTLRRILGQAVFVGLVPGRPERAFYGRAIRAALEARGWAVVLETQEPHRAAWARFAARHARVPVEISDEPARAA
jgi:hypothetical protein